MIYRIFVFMAAALCMLLLLRLALGRCPARFRLGRNTRCLVYLSVRGQERMLEQSAKGLLWFFYQNGITGGIVIHGAMLDRETRDAACSLAEKHSCITFIEDGESPWIRKTNC